MNDSEQIKQEISQLAFDIKSLLSNKNKTLSLAESCTGGGISSAITSIPGASEYFSGSVVAYQNELKVKLLGVPCRVIDEYDVVSPEVVECMVEGACRLFQSDYAISTSGYAGPTGGSDKVSIGTICIGYGNPSDIRSFVCHLHNDRDSNVLIAILKALKLFKEFIESDMLQ